MADFFSCWYNNYCFYWKFVRFYCLQKLVRDFERDIFFVGCDDFDWEDDADL